MAFCERYTIDLSLSTKDKSTAEVLKTMSFDERLAHQVALIMSEWSPGDVKTLPAPEVVLKHKTNNPEAYATLEEQALRELGIVRPPELSLAPPAEASYEQPQPEGHSSEAA